MEKSLDKALNGINARGAVVADANGLCLARAGDGEQRSSGFIKAIADEAERLTGINNCFSIAWVHYSIQVHVSICHKYFCFCYEQLLSTAFNSLSEIQAIRIVLLLWSLGLEL
tara:strand:- start:298 stop:636 length:339 start_codon:yes stop_codon:yes gene_type:complete